MLLYLNVSKCCIIFWFLHSISLFSNPIVIDLFLRYVCELVHMQGTKATAFLTFMWITREIFILVGVGEGALSFHSRLIESTDVTMGKWCWGWRWLNWFRYLEEVLFIQNRHLTSSRYQSQDFNLIFKYYNDLDDWAADLGSLWVQVPYRPLSTPPPAPTRWFQVEQKHRLTALHKWWELVLWLTVTAQRGLRLVKVFFSRALSLFPSSLVIKPNVVTSAPMHSCFPANLPPAADPRSPHPPPLRAFTASSSLPLAAAATWRRRINESEYLGRRNAQRSATQSATVTQRARGHAQGFGLSKFEVRLHPKITLNQRHPPPPAPQPTHSPLGNSGALALCNQSFHGKKDERQKKRNRFSSPQPI